MNDETFTDLMYFWRNVEALSPQMIPKEAPGDNKQPTRNWAAGSKPPWLDEGFKRRRIPTNKAWQHTVYAVTYDRTRFIKLLEQLLGKQPDVFEERPTGQSCVFSLTFDELGRPLTETLNISMAAWFYGIIETEGLEALTGSEICNTKGLNISVGRLDIPPANSGFPGFDCLLDQMRTKLAWDLGHLVEDQPVDYQWFSSFTQLVVNKCNLTRLIKGRPIHRVRSVKIFRPKKTNSDNKTKVQDDFLNSFFIRDLNRMISSRLSGTGVGLQRFLDPPPSLKKTDIRIERRSALDLLQPNNFPAGSWPAEHPLVWSQQVAVNSVWQNLAGNGGIFSVNGPPGTGKTTLLRDIVAAIIVDRAKLLADRGGHLLGGRKTISVGDRDIPYFTIDQALTGFSIVVASSNNGAVENVSIELPKKGAIHDIWCNEVNVYPDIAGELLREPAWALIAGRLGNKSNRTGFVSRFWWQKSDDNEKVSGLRERLKSIIQGIVQPEISWHEAVYRFQKALAEEKKWRRRISELQELPAVMNELERDASAHHRELAVTTDPRAAIQERINDLEQRIADDCRRIARLDHHIENQKMIKPGLLEWLSTFGKSHRQWRKKLSSLIEEQQGIENVQNAANNQLRVEKAALTRIDEAVVKIKKRIQDIEAKKAAAKSTIEEARTMLGLNWPDFNAADHDQETSSPWACPQWQEARIRVFIAAMNLHCAFIEDNARKMMANLGLAVDMLQGKIPDSKTKVVALESLSIACPVISTTFASVANLFGDLGRESIGWLLIDEAGQATPQAAVGAIWRALRIVVVGDPMQLESVITLPPTVESMLAAFHGKLDSRWHPSRTSVQVLADQATPIGTMIGKGDSALWVGAPLRVHRRCDDPMFSISNAIAYDGMMVKQKQPDTRSWPASAWINVTKTIANGNWIPAEGEVLNDLLAELINHCRVPEKDIFLISPFRDVVRQLQSFRGHYHLAAEHIGTIHTTQGKEAAVVILVLGGGTSGSRDWAAMKPNLLNVAVSRAKTRLYVVGERDDWARRRFFDILADELMVRQVPSVSTQSQTAM